MFSISEGRPDIVYSVQVTQKQETCKDARRHSVGRAWDGRECRAKENLEATNLVQPESANTSEAQCRAVSG